MWIRTLEALEVFKATALVDLTDVKRTVITSIWHQLYENLISKLSQLNCKMTSIFTFEDFQTFVASFECAVHCRILHNDRLKKKCR